MKSVKVATLAAIVAAATMAARPELSAQGAKEARMTQTTIGIPESIKAEHEEIHADLVRATKLQGPVGDAARALAAVLHPHFVREEQIALPPLGLLAPLAAGETDVEMAAVLPMTDSLRQELPQMLQQHKAIADATRHLGEVARARGNPGAARLAEKLLLHARSEEEVFYPAAILVGELVRERTSAPAITP